MFTVIVTLAGKSEAFMYETVHIALVHFDQRAEKIDLELSKRPRAKSDYGTEYYSHVYAVALFSPEWCRLQSHVRVL
jgi:hypothetical protein